MAHWPSCVAKTRQSLHRKMSNQEAEKVHLKFMKWCLGVHRYTSNSACWGEFGRLPLIDSFIKQSLKYYTRLEDLSDDSLVKKALNEQKRLSLSWYTAIDKLQSLNDTATTKQPYFDIFTDYWNQYVKAQSKLDFYRTVKPSFDNKTENYLTLIPDFEHRTTITKIRTSSHKLGVEAGRYKSLPREERICTNCDMGSIDDERHLIEDCHLINNERTRLLATIGVQSTYDLDASTLFKCLLLDEDSTTPNNNNMDRRNRCRKIAKVITDMYKIKIDNS